MTNYLAIPEAPDHDCSMSEGYCKGCVRWMEYVRAWQFDRDNLNFQDIDLETSK
jgi:hypothetical protein